MQTSSGRGPVSAAPGVHEDLRPLFPQDLSLLPRRSLPWGPRLTCRGCPFTMFGLKSGGESLLRRCTGGSALRQTPFAFWAPDLARGNLAPPLPRSSARGPVSLLRDCGRPASTSADSSLGDCGPRRRAENPEDGCLGRG